ncbi:MAG TPA: HEPN domain-containing protein [Thermoplasmata archaeon]|nr:HEPN domain-containing protein [Thermoplasmata archaeon]
MAGELSPVELRFEEFKEAARALKDRGDLSLLNSAEDTFRKSLLLTAASWFEHLITRSIVDAAAQASNNCVPVVNFVQNKGIRRQFHTFFNWEAKNGSQFFGLFGPEFAEKMKLLLAADEQLRTALEAFIEIGAERNRMIHGNYGVYSLDKTTEEVYGLYRTAAVFPVRFDDELKRIAIPPTESPLPPNSE